MKKLLFDLEATQPIDGGFHGGGEYTKVVFKELIKKKDKIELECFYNSKKPLDESITSLLSINKIKIIDIQSYKNLQELIDENNYDKFYSGLPYNYHDLRSKHCKFIFTIHGLRPLECPTDKYEFKYSNNFIDDLKYCMKQLFTTTYVSNKILKFKRIINKENTTIIVPSNHTKYALNVFLNTDVNNVKVLYSPLKETSFKLDENTLDDFNRLNLIDKNYILIVNGGRWVKNTYRALVAMDRIFSKDERIKNDYKVLVCGINKETRLLNRIINKENFVTPGYVSQSLLNYLYSKCYLLLYPSLNEGFGYPPIEAFSFKKPVACSSITSLSEICGSAPAYFNPFDVNEIQNRVSSLIYDKDLYNHKSKISYKQYKLVTAKQELMLDELIKTLV